MIRLDDSPAHLPTVSKLDTFSRYLAFLYVIMLALPIPLQEPRLFLHDALLLIMAILILLRRKSIRQMVTCHLWLDLFLITSFVVSACHANQALSDIYEWTVFAYQVVLFVYFAELRLSQRDCLTLAIALYTAVIAAFLYELTPLPTRFCFQAPNMAETSMSFLAQRFAFTLKNPNLFGVFYAIPTALLTRVLAQQDWTVVALKRKLGLLLLPVPLMLPILSSASKHGLLSCALFLSWPALLFPTWKRLLRPAALLAVLVLFMVFETTVLFVTFPLSSDAPFVNTTPGMYSLHQTAYAHMLLTPPTRLLTGLGATELRQEYPRFCDRQQVRETLSQYNAPELFHCFTTYMDPHQEYLNLTLLFGLPCTLLILIFWLTLPRRSASSLKFTVTLFVIAVLAAACWDDLFSKRYLWIAAAILVPIKESKS